MIELILHKSRRLYCAFLDYEKAFDKIERAFLWQKLLNHNINGKILSVIKNMYENAKSCVMVGMKKSDYFQTFTGVRQGENLSPLLFALFLNDLKAKLTPYMDRLRTLNEMSCDLDLSDEDLDLLVHLFILLYADDTAVCAESPECLQIGLNCVNEYCDQWKLKLNADKCKVMIFSRGKVRNIPLWFIGDKRLEVVFDFGYLGLKLNYNNKFKTAQIDLCTRASRAMFLLLKKANRLSLPLDVILDLFDKTVLPVLTYCCEVWGTAVIEQTRVLQRRFYKMVFQLRKSTPTLMLFGETGKVPVDVHIKSRVLNYWFRLCHPDYKDKISSHIYKLLYKLYINDLYVSPYVNFVKNTLQEIGLNGIWLNQENMNFSPLWFKEKVKRCLLDNFVHNWYSSLDNENILLNYRMFKSSFGQESYITLLPTNLAIKLARFRTTNNVLPINRLRYEDIPRNERLCPKCMLREIGDEFHYVFCCPYFELKRKACLPKYFLKRPNAIKFSQLFNSGKKTLLKVTHFVDYIQRELRG